MARLARVEIFAEDEIAIVHVMNRTVRRCFLMGDDSLTGKNFDHRKAWMELELKHLAMHFGIDLLGYAILSNHFHLILRSRPDVVEQWDDTEVARRWLWLCPKRKDVNNRPLAPTEFELDMIRNDPAKLKSIRSRLSDISWWIRLLSQKIAQRANRDDGEIGKFWQARYRAVRLLDETAILACAAYVDLNPIRAAMAETIETSDFTSAQQRVLDLQPRTLTATSPSEEDKSTCALKNLPTATRTGSSFLAPLSINELRDALGPCVHTAGNRASDKGFLSMSVASYVELLDWTARKIRGDKRGVTPVSAEPIFMRTGISADAWTELVRDFGKLFCTVAGQPHVIDSHRSPRRSQRSKTRQRARELLVR